MMQHLKIAMFISVLLLFNLSCSNFTYIPKGKKHQLKEHPSPLIFDRIVEFRIAEGGWPVSRTDFISKGTRYYEVFADFPYEYTSFKIADSNRMTLYFSGHAKDRNAYQRSGKTDLNGYNGSVHFWKENGRFLWKVKMH